MRDEVATVSHVMAPHRKMRDAVGTVDAAEDASIHAAASIAPNVAFF